MLVLQKKYTSDLFKRFRMVNCKITATPTNVNEKLQLEDDTKKEDAKSLKSLVRGLIYLAHTLSDISFLVGFVSRFISNPIYINLELQKRFYAMLLEL